jgi:peptidoglycan hydrolase CwlO-like protein
LEKDCVKFVEEKESMVKDNATLQEARHFLTAEISEAKNVVVQAAGQEKLLRDEMGVSEAKITQLQESLEKCQHELQSSND